MPELTSATRNATGTLALGLLGALLAVLTWHLLAVSGMVPGAGVPPPLDVLRASGSMLQDGILLDLRITVARVSIGVALGSLLALPVGFLLAWYPTLRAMFEPLVNFFRALPPIALVPLVVVIFGIGESARISILIYASFFASVIVLFEGIGGLDPTLVRAARVLGANGWELFTRTVVPASLPHVFTALRVALGVCWATVVAAELVAAQRGLGAAIQKAGTFYNIDEIYVGIALIGICALVMDLGLKLLQSWLTRWQEKAG